MFYAIVCGGRDFIDIRSFVHVMNFFVKKYSITTIVSGGQTGADTLAKEYATVKNIGSIEEKADWTKGKKAGPIRNRKMLDENPIELVIGFAGDVGTTDMLDYAVENDVLAIRFVPVPHEIINDRILVGQLIDWKTKTIIGVVKLKQD